MGKREFRQAARDQRVCAVTGRAGRDFHAHHVVREQDILVGNPDDPRNALRLALSVHLNHHGIHKIPLSALTDENIEFAFETFGTHAVDYLRRNYVGRDERVNRHVQAIVRGRLHDRGDPDQG